MFESMVNKLDISAGVIYKFTQGDCHHMALALHSLDPSWQLYRLDSLTESHAFVFKDGWALDICGLKPLKKMAEYWQTTLESVAATDHHELLSWPDHFDSQTECEHFAPLIIDYANEALNTLSLS